MAVTPSYRAQSPASDFLAPARRRHADGATLVAWFVAVLMIVPARMVVAKVPFSLTPADLIALLAALLWLCAHFTTTLGMAKGHNPVRTALFVYSVAMLATYGYATYGYLPGDELNLADHSAVLVVGLVGVGLVVVDGVRGDQSLDLLLRTVVVTGAIVAVIGIAQFVLDLDLTRYLDLPGLRYTSEEVFVTEREDLRRVAATTGHPIEFGVLCAMVLPVAVHYGFRARRRGEPAWRWWVCAALIVSGLMFSVSRSAVLTLAVGGVVLFLGWPARRRVWALVVAVGYLVLIKLTVPGLLGTFYGLFTNFSTDNSVRYRTHDYAAAAAEISRHPWLGRGLGTWYAPKHQVFDNQYILSMVETGVVGVLAFAGIFLTGIYAALRARRISVDADRRDLCLTVVACLVAPLLGAATFDLYSFHMVTGLSFVLVGAAGALLRTARDPTVPVR